MNAKTGNLCQRCKHRLRRVFIPIHPENYIYPEDEQLSPNEDNIIIANQCLVLDIDITDELTVECSHFVENKSSKNENILFFKNLNI